MLAGLGALLLLSAPAKAETVNCKTISALPAVISTQGVYCLKYDLATSIASGSAISIETNNVTIDCNGHRLGGLAAGPSTTARGISSVDRSNIIVRGCSVRGFSTGINLNFTASPPRGFLVEDNRLDGNTTRGIAVFGAGSQVRRNRVIDTGGSSSGSTMAIGIYAGYGVDLMDNTVDGVTGTLAPGSFAGGIWMTTASGAVIADNRVRNVVGDGSARGIWIMEEDSAIIRDNFIGHVSRTSVGPVFGLFCSNSPSLARGNVVQDSAAHEAHACIDGGDNVFN
jgi:hypothetical protein